ncbi:hypothetical protein [Pseudobutyrivibrio xylanivorans]|uniref:Lipoprotein n=1 Tax=Pseudobutyrivibrio xylanivorans TaxID=185007 RepID=A0A5P6VTJ6_PSEXY|nr:hypothetical protein [Pseudobutyrivibrio xylanivorans]QFJ55953.1 hypothetical protein FXF36_14165 [Pseudobutyrivibrio xylanivorans]
MKNRIVKKMVAISLVGVMALGMVACGNNADEAVESETAVEESVEQEASETEPTEAETETEAESQSANLPAYEYPGPEYFYTVVYQYLIDEFGANYEQADVCIPCPIIIAEDYDDKEDIKLWGNFWIYNYELNGDTLEAVSGGSYPGCLHIKMDNEANYVVSEFEAVGDGADYEPTAKKIFGKYYEDLVKSGENTEENEALRAQIISNYVFANNLSIKAYKDYGWDPVSLPEQNIDSFYSQLD